MRKTLSYIAPLLCTLALVHGGPALAFSDGNFLVYRVGNGSTPLTSAAAPVFIEERRASDGALVSTVAMPTSTVLPNRALTAEGDNPAEGMISLSSNRRYVIVTGYAANPGAPDVASTTSSSVNRVIGRINGAGTVVTDTALNAAFSTGNIHGATSDDGMRFWASGSVGGVQFANAGMGTSNQVTNTPASVNAIAVAINQSGLTQLYGTSNLAPNANVFAIGSGLPTTSGQASTSLNGMSTAAGPNPGQFVFNEDFDTLYIADSRSFASGGGIQKWTRSITTWTQVGVLASGFAEPPVGLAGYSTPSGFVLLASMPGALHRITDSGGHSSASWTNTLVANAGINRAFRGVAMAPVSPPTIAKSFGAASIATNATTSLTFNIGSTNTVSALTGVAFTDSLPSGLVVAAPNGLSGSCGGGTISAIAGGSTVSLSNATLAPSASCTFSVNVRGTTVGTKANSVTVSSTNGGTGNTATASVNVVPAAPTIISPGEGNIVPIPVSVVGTTTEPTGTVITVLEGATTLCTATFTGGNWSCTVPAASAPGGSHTITARASSGAFQGASSAPVTFTAVYVTSATVATSGTPTAFGQSVTFTATISNNVAGAAPGGSVQFKDGAANLGTAVTLVPGSSSSTAQLTVSTLAVGSHSITAVYSGDSTHTGSTSPAITQVVGKASQAITFDPLPPRAMGDPPFAVSASASSGLVVAFTSLTQPVCTVSGSTVTLVSPGTCTIAANQAGDSRYEAAPQVTRSFNVASTALAPGDFNDDGRSDIIIRDSVDGTHYGWLMNGLTVASGGYLLAAGSGWQVVHEGDFNGDGKADILIQHTDGSVYMWLMNGLTVTGGGYLLAATSGFSVTHVGDFNGDGKADVLLRHAHGSIYVQTMDGAAATGGTFLQGAGSGWTVADVADFNGDGRSDILMTHLDGSIYAYLMNGTAIQAGTFLLGAGSGWSPTATGDFNGDGKADILITHTDGGVYAWQMNGLAIATGTYLQSPGTGWSIDRATDLDGDGKADIVIKHADGSYYAWIMNGLTVAGGGYLLGAGTGWSVSQALDLNGDGKSDLLIEHTDGSIYGWLMNGATIVNGTYLAAAGAWRVAP